MQDRSRIRIKICGMTNRDDAQLAVSLGVDAIGLIFYPKSPRGINITQAQKIIFELPPFVTKVAVFVDPQEQEVKDVLAQVQIDLLQFHGDETDAFCNRFNKPFIKAIPVATKIQDYSWEDQYPHASAFLLDTYREDNKGGTGEAFRWEPLPKTLKKPVILAGGLTPTNVAIAINKMQPYAVDVTTGVEGKKGYKDANKMKEFVKAVSLII